MNRIFLLRYRNLLLFSRSRHDDRHESRDEKRDRDRERDKEEKEKKADNGIEIPSILPDGETIGSKMAGLSADKIKVIVMTVSFNN